MSKKLAYNELDLYEELQKSRMPKAANNSLYEGPHEHDDRLRFEATFSPSQRPSTRSVPANSLRKRPAPAANAPAIGKRVKSLRARFAEYDKQIAEERYGKLEKAVGIVAGQFREASEKRIDDLYAVIKPELEGVYESEFTRDTFKYELKAMEELAAPRSSKEEGAPICGVLGSEGCELFEIKEGPAKFVRDMKAAIQRALSRI